MARPPDPTIRARLRERAIDYVLAHGIADLSLRPLAAKLGTNARMLVYHFGSREGLMRAILAGLREREDARIARWLATSKGGGSRTLAAFVLWYWRRVSAPAARPAVLLLFELYGLALRHPAEYPSVLGDPVAYWQRLTRQVGLESGGDATIATLALAALRGLLLDLAATGDRLRTGRAMRALARSLDTGA
jgi:AcrR family transcriptional regulator